MMQKVKVHSVKIHWPVQVVNPCSEISLPTTYYVRPFTVLRLRLDGVRVTDYTKDGLAESVYVNPNEVYDPYQ